MRFQRTRFLGLLAVVLFASNTERLHGQVPDDQKSVLAFDVYLDRISSSDLASSTGMSASGGPMSVNANNPIQPDEIRRVFGAVSAPASLQSIQGLSEGVEQLEFNFFVRMQFKDQNAADKAFAEMSEGSQSTTIGEKQCLRPPPGPTVPGNVAFHRLSPDIIEVGSDDYLKLSDRNVFSDNLLDAWGKMPKAAIRVAVDLESAKHLVDEAMQMANGNVPPMAQPALSMVNNMSVLRLGLDFSSDNLLWLTATGKDESATGQINATLGGILAMAKGIGTQQLSMAGPDAQGPGGELLAALATQVDGNDVNIVLPRPEGLEKAIGGAMSQMMSMGGPPMIEGGPPMIAGEPPMIAGEQPGAAANADPFGGDPFGGDGGADPAPAAENTDDPFGGDGSDPFGN